MSVYVADYVLHYRLQLQHTVGPVYACRFQTSPGSLRGRDMPRAVKGCFRLVLYLGDSQVSRPDTLVT